MYLENRNLDKLIRHSASVMLHDRIVKWTRFWFRVLFWMVAVALMGLQLITHFQGGWR